MEQQLVTRIAPTPSGYLHLGNAFNFLYTWLIARSAGGKVILRIDDLDQERARPEYIENIFRTLEWLGMDWDEGPQTPDELTNTWSQTHRMDLYHELIDQLITTGQVYACTCSRKSLAELGIDGPYPNICYPEQLPLNTADSALRVYVPDPCIIEFNEHKVDLYQAMGGFVVRRKDGIPAYQIASLADDTQFGVNTIVRGIDLLDSTAAQLYLAELTSNKAFEQTGFIHHPLLTDNLGEKLSKTTGNSGNATLEEQFSSPQKVYELCAEWLQLPANNEPLTNINALLHAFNKR